MGLGRRERIKFKIRNGGIKSLVHSEILEYLLYPFIPRKDTAPIAKALLAEFGQIEYILTAPEAVLAKIPGVTASAALFLSVLKAIVTRSAIENFEGKAKIQTYDDACKYLEFFIGYEQVEKLVALFFGPTGKLLLAKEISSGDAGHTAADLPQIAKHALNIGATSVIVGHNHPSGSPTPSQTDIESTQFMAYALDCLGIKLLDHIIVSGSEYDCIRFYLTEEDALATTFSDHRVPYIFKK